MRVNNSISESCAPNVPVQYIKTVKHFWQNEDSLHFRLCVVISSQIIPIGLADVAVTAQESERMIENLIAISRA